MLPSPLAAAALAPPSPRAATPPAGRPGVLVVDDDDLVRGVIRAGLERDGFRVWVAAGGAEALTAYRANAAAIAVVLLDVLMPEMDGPSTLEALRSLNGNATACFMSGDLGAYEVGDLLRRGARHVFAKPLCLAELAATLRAVVGTAAPDPA